MAVNLSMLAGAGAQFFDNSGVILSGGLIYTYAAGTTTPQAAYTSSSGGTAHSNPIVLNSAGRVASGGEIWLTDAVSYKFVLQTSAAVTIATYDNVTGNSSGIYAAFAASSGSSLVGYIQTGTGAVATTVQAKLRQTVSAADFSTVTQAIPSGGTIVIPSGTYNITSNTDFGTCELVFNEGALFNVTASVNVYIRKQVLAGDYQIFSTTGNIIIANNVNPMWFGAVRAISSPGPTVAAANTLAFRRAAKSFYTDYSVNTGTAAIPSGPQINWSLIVPPGAFYLSNGFSMPVGVPIRGAGVNSLLIRLLVNADADTAIPLVTIGQTLGPAPTLAYVNDTIGPISPFNSAGFKESSAQASDLFFVDQNPTKAALKPLFPGVQLSNLFFTSCGISIDFNGAGDVTGNNIICDQGLTNLTFGACQNINLSNVILYNSNFGITFGTNVADISITNLIIEYPKYSGVYFTEANGNIDDVKFSNCSFFMNEQYTTFAGMVRNRASNVNAFFYNCSFRNIYGPAILNDLATAGNRLTFQDCNFDANRTNAAYTQGSTMSAMSIMGGTYIFTNCQFKNMYNSSITSFGPITLYVNGLFYSGTNLGASPQFNFASGPGTAYFIGALGTGVGSLSTGAGITVNTTASYLV